MFFRRRYASSVLTVCTANICRSPMAEGMLRAEIEKRGLPGKIWVDSAGTHASQPGRPPDPRAQRVCQLEGIDITRVRARQVRQEDFDRFDYILAMESRNFQWLVEACPEPIHHKISLAGSWSAESADCDIPDPYYGNRQGFSHVYELLHSALEGFVNKNFV